mgnify:CR=1 FL=1
MQSLAALARCSAVCLALAVGVAPACKAEVAAGSTDGAQVFREVCAHCHGALGAPPAQLAATVKDLTAAEFQARATLEVVREQVKHGSASKVMPAFADVLSEAQVDAVAGYVLTLGRAGEGP